MNELDSIEGPLKEKVADLVRKGVKLEADLAAANKTISKRDVALEKLGALRKDADNAIQALASDLESVRKQYENEVEDLQGQIFTLNKKVELLSSENAKLKTGEGVDIEAIINAPEFADIKDFLEDSTGDELIRRINEAHPEWDLSFLTGGGVESSTAHAEDLEGTGTDENRGVDPTEAGTEGVDPNEVDPEVVIPNSVSPDF